MQFSRYPAADQNEISISLLLSQLSDGVLQRFHAFFFHV